MVQGNSLYIISSSNNRSIEQRKNPEPQLLITPICHLQPWKNLQQQKYRHILSVQRNLLKGGNLQHLGTYSTRIDIHEPKRWRDKLILVGINWQDDVSAIHTTTTYTCMDCMPSQLETDAHARCQIKQRNKRLLYKEEMNSRTNLFLLDEERSRYQKNRESKQKNFQEYSQIREHLLSSNIQKSTLQLS